TPPMTSPAGGARHALIVATSVYQDPQLPRLHAPEQDAANIGAVLGNTDIGRFEVAPHVVNATAREVRQRIGQFLRNRSTKDTVLLYLSCHGIKDSRQQLYFAATDSEQRDPEATAIESRWLIDRL